MSVHGFSDIRPRPQNVRLWGKSGKHRLNASISHFDANRTSRIADPLSQLHTELFSKNALSFWGDRDSARAIDAAYPTLCEAVRA
jgi:hypothetical protein